MYGGCCRNVKHRLIATPETLTTVKWTKLLSWYHTKIISDSKIRLDNLIMCVWQQVLPTLFTVMHYTWRSSEVSVWFHNSVQTCVSAADLLIRRSCLQAGEWEVSGSPQQEVKHSLSRGCKRFVLAVPSKGPGRRSKRVQIRLEHNVYHLHATYNS